MKFLMQIISFWGQQFSIIAIVLKYKALRLLNICYQPIINNEPPSIFSCEAIPIIEFDKANAIWF